MPDNTTPHDAADRLDQVWDDVIRSGSDGSPGLAGDAAASAAFASYLDQLAPSLDASARERMRARVLASDSRDAKHMQRQPMPMSNAGEVIAPLPRQPRRATRRSWLHHPLTQIAATALLVVGLIGSWLVVRGTGDPDRSTPQFAAGSPSSGQTNPAGGGGRFGLISLEIDRFGQDHVLTATMRRVTLAPGALWDFDNGPYALGSNLAGRFLESGSVTVSGPDGEMVLEAGQRVDGAGMKPGGFLNAIQNPGREPAVIVELLVHGDDGDPLPEPPMGSTVEEIGSTPFQQPAGAVTRVNLMRITVNGAETPAVQRSGRQQTVFIAVEAGTMTVQPRTGMFFAVGAIGEPVPAASPKIATDETEPFILGAGETVRGDSPSEVVTAAGNDSLTMLALSVEHMYGQDVAQARFFADPVTWSGPAGTDEITLSLRRITLDPGSEWTREQSGVTQLWVRSGELTLTFGTGEPARTVAASDSASHGGEGPITLSNMGVEPVELIEGIVLAGRSESSLVSNVPAGVSVDILATGVVPISGTIDVMLYADSALAGQGGSEYVQAGARLGSVIEGEIGFARLGGSIEVLRGVSADGTAGLETLGMLGDPITLATGDAFLAHPGSGFSVDATGDAANRYVVLAVAATGKVDQPAASPVANVAATQGQMIEVTPADCTIEPRTIDEFTTILSDPFAEGTPQTGMRDLAATGVLADQETIEDVTDTVRQVVACDAAGKHLEMYSLYSANMLRYHAAAGNMTIDEIQALDQIEEPESTTPVSGYIAVENVIVFPDGRVGAMVNANGELAYLTFVFEDGRWLIDIWDDQLSEPGATPEA